MDTLCTLFKEKEAKRFKIKVCVILMLIENHKILLSRRYQTGIDDGNYVLPMGCIDGNESLRSALCREAKEECNIEIEQQHLHACHLLHRLYHIPQYDYSFEQLDLFFQVTSYKGTIQNNEPTKCDQLAFFPLNDLPQNLLPYLRQAITCSMNGIFYSEYGFGG